MTYGLGSSYRNCNRKANRLAGVGRLRTGHWRRLACHLLLYAALACCGSASSGGSSGSSGAWGSLIVAAAAQPVSGGSNTPNPLCSQWAINQTTQTEVTGCAADAAGGFTVKGQPVTSMPNNAVANVKVFGALGNASTSGNDTLAIQAAINSLPNGGIVYVPPGTYCITNPLTVPQQGITIQATNRQVASTFTACGKDISIFNLTGFHTQIRDLFIVGSNIIGTQQPAVIVGTGCVECTLQNVQVFFGQYNVSVAANGEFHLLDSKFSFAYGNALVYTQSGGYILRNKFDQAWLVVPTGSFAAAYNAWAATHAYSAGAFVQLPGGQIIQTVAGGTSGGSAPSPQPYGVNITDGTVVWQLVMPNGNYSEIQCDTNCGAQLLIDSNDMTGSFNTSLNITNSLSGAAPTNIQFSDNSPSQAIFSNVWQQSGSGLTVVNNQMGTLANNSASVDISGSGNATIYGNTITLLSGGQGVYLGAGSIDAITGNNINAAAGNGIYVNTGISNWDATGNVFSGTGFGVTIGGAGSDYYSVCGNQVSSTISALYNNSGGSTPAHAILCDVTSAVYTPGSFPNPAGTTSVGTCVMMGLGSSATITPVKTGRIHIDVSFQASNNTTGDAIGFGLKIGTGSAPANAAALTGNDVGPICGAYSWGGSGITGGIGNQQHLAGNFIGSIGTAYWVDVPIEALTGGTASIGKVQITLNEF